MSQQSNYSRIFHEVVSVEAWHSSFDDKTNLATIHADVSFMNAKLGAEKDCPVRFSLAIRRAEVSLLIPDREPLAFVQSSISRQLGPQGQRTLEIESGRGAEGSVSASLNPIAPVPVNISANAKLHGNETSRVHTSLTEKIGPFTVRHFNQRGTQCWEVFTENGVALLGKAWDPVLEPRMKVKKLNNSRLDPVIRIRVRCKREDLLISHLSFKSPKLLDHMGWQSNKNKEAAATAYIRSKLVDRNLTPEDFEEEYSLIFLAESIVSEEIV